jgi:hypothetical protein
MYGWIPCVVVPAFAAETVHADNAFLSGLITDDAGSRGLEDGRDVKVSQAGGQILYHCVSVQVAGRCCCLAEKRD